MEKIPEAEIPKKQRKKKVMTPEMLEQLALARKKALEIKKTLKGNDEAKIEHAKEKIKKQRSRPKKKEEIRAIAEEQLKEESEHSDIMPDLNDNVEYTETGVVIDLHSEEAIEKLKVEEGLKPDEDKGTPSPPPPLAPNGAGLDIPKMVLNVEDKPKKEKFLMASSSDESDEEDKIIYIKKKSKRKKDRERGFLEPPPSQQPIQYQQDPVAYRPGPPSLYNDPRSNFGYFNNNNLNFR